MINCQSKSRLDDFADKPDHCEIENRERSLWREAREG